MPSWLYVAGVLILFSGLLVLLVAETTWQRLMPQFSRWANQASVAGLLLFVGLEWLGLTLLASGSGDVWHGWQSQRWEPVDAHVVDSRLIEVRQFRSSTPAYRADVTYSYVAGGRERRAERLDFGDTSTSNRSLVEDRLLRQFAPGSRVTARVNPDAPEEAVLEPGVTLHAALITAFGATLFLVGLFQVTRLLSDWNGDRSAPRVKQS